MSHSVTGRIDCRVVIGLGSVSWHGAMLEARAPDRVGQRRRPRPSSGETRGEVILVAQCRQHRAERHLVDPVVLVQRAR